MIKKGLLLAVALGLGSPVLGADLPPLITKGGGFNGYPVGCGFYYGLGTAGSAGAVNGAVVGTQIVQGELNATVGYTCPFATSAFWFAEGSVGMTNVNGSVNGLALSGPVVLRERLGAGSPINSVFNPFSTSLSVPSLPLLPNGVTANPNAQPYFFVGLEEQDMTPQLGNGTSGHVWAVSGMVGIGLLTRLSNNVVVDTWAGFEPRSQTFCPGNGLACASLGNRGVVGASFKY
jgi:hypothetical protein